jgi:hypothetical protein
VRGRLVRTSTRLCPGAALVQFLKIGDVERIDFQDYRKPFASLNYFINVAIISADGSKTIWLNAR